MSVPVIASSDLGEALAVAANDGSLTIVSRGSTLPATLPAAGPRLATIRAIAAEAGIDASMVMRYFGSKAGLFAAAASIALNESPLIESIPCSRFFPLLHGVTISALFSV